ncbi:PorT family protein [Flammeovirga pectinis]|uniref:PorT family protein n=1 Tax=Flammeovirga pectinis TaxID=2494373 RepID=A0A3Q9FQR8_9BACT|nr:porin family protein [Flammeovirga pectinis]AZQ63075.1 PorT family protein [Flammeovirga pectinis]
MKKLLSILLLSVASIMTINAQGVLGVKGGLSHAGILVENPDGGLIPGFVGGVTYDLPINEKLTFGVELLYSQQGVYKNSNIPLQFPSELTGLPETLNYSASGETHIRLNYVNVPIVLKYGFGENGNFKLFGGGQVGFLVNNKKTWKGDVTLTGAESGNDYMPVFSEILTASGLPTSNDDMQSIADQQDFKKVDFAFVIGASYDFANTPLSLDFRANYGMVDINNSGDINSNDNTSDDWMKNMSLQLTLKYSIFAL